MNGGITLRAAAARTHLLHPSHVYCMLADDLGARLVLGLHISVSPVHFRAQFDTHRAFPRLELLQCLRLVDFALVEEANALMLLFEKSILLCL